MSSIISAISSGGIGLWGLALFSKYATRPFDEEIINKREVEGF
jgi:hypothetical protein